MKLKLEYPFSEKWKHGYIVTNNENRKNVILYNSQKDRSTVSYARYIVSVKEGRFLSKNEHVDHVNDDKTDDRLENLQILTQKYNSVKEGNRRGRLKALLVCPVCNTSFTVRKGNSQACASKKGKVSCCSKDCSNVFKTFNLSKEEQKKISNDTLLHVFREH